MTPGGRGATWCPGRICELLICVTANWSAPRRGRDRGTIESATPSSDRPVDSTDFLIPRQVFSIATRLQNPRLRLASSSGYLFLKLRFLKPEPSSGCGTGFQWLFGTCLVEGLRQRSDSGPVICGSVWRWPILAPRVGLLPNSALPWLLLILSLTGCCMSSATSTALAEIGGRTAEDGIGI